MLVPPPGRFSIRTCWSQLLESRSPTMRAITSVGPPAANGTTIRTGWVGQARAFARLATMPDASADAAASALKQRRVIITMYLQQHWTTGKHSWTGRRCIGVATISALNAIACPPTLYELVAGGSGHPQDCTARRRSERRACPIIEFIILGTVIIFRHPHHCGVRRRTGNYWQGPSGCQWQGCRALGRGAPDRALPRGPGSGATLNSPGAPCERC